MSGVERQESLIVRLFPRELRDKVNSGDILALSDEHKRLSEEAGYRRRALLANIFFALIEKFRDFDRELGVDPLAAVEGLLRKIKVRYQVVVPEGLGEKLSSGGIVWYGEHPKQIEPFLMAAAAMGQSGRSDLKGVAADYMTGFGENVARHLEPVYSNNGCLAESQKELPFVEREKRMFVNLFRHGAFSMREAVMKNVAAIANLARHLDEGGMVLITPSLGEDKTWKRGVGDIVGKLRPDSSVNFIPVYVLGPSGTKTFFTGGRFKVFFGEPLCKEDLVAETEKLMVGLSPRTRSIMTTRVLQSHYGEQKRALLGHLS